jgi:hypothetical protein
VDKLSWAVIRRLSSTLIKMNELTKERGWEPDLQLE